jgi:predicted phage-related endonuclease
VIERIQIVSREQWLTLRKSDVTASAVACLFGVHPYVTPLALFQEKNGLELPEIDNAVLRRGRLLEGAVAVAVEEAHPEWKLTKATEYFRDPDVRVGCTPDFFVSNDPRGLGIIQAKTVAPSVFKKAWADGPPFWIALQAATEMMLTGATWGAVAALVVDPWKMDCLIYPIPRHEGVEDRIREAVAKFWQDVEWGEEPAFDYARDGDLIAALFPAAVPLKSVDLMGDNHLPVILAERAVAKEAIRVAQDRCIEIDNEIRAKIGDAEIATLDGYVITLKTQIRRAYEVKASTSRRLNITETRERNDDAAGPY